MFQQAGVAFSVSERADVVPGRRYRGFGKRTLDLVLGVPLTVLALPLMGMLAIVSVLSLRSWPLFLQARVGRRGQIIRVPKIRTLPRVVSRDADKYEVAAISIPRPCSILRRTHLDELPQLFCVLLGTMSLVGPRPDMPAMVERYPPDFADRRSVVRPGCTGLWQIGAHNGGMIYEGQAYDDYYVAHVGARLDAWILFRTVSVLLVSAERGVTISDIPAWTTSRSAVEGPIELEIDLTGSEIDLTELDESQQTEIAS